MDRAVETPGDGRIRELLRNPFFQFAIAGLIGLAVISTVSIMASRQSGEEEAMTEARRLTEVVANIVVQPALTSGSSYLATLPPWMRSTRSCKNV